MRSRGKHIAIGWAFVALAVAPIAGVASAQPRERVHTAPARIASDCSRDVTAGLSTWLGSLPARSTARLRPRACYRVDGTIELEGRRGLSIDGRGATLRAMIQGDPNRAALRFLAGSDVAVRDLVVRGSLPPGTPFTYALQWQHAFDFRGVRGVTLEHVQARGVYGDGVYLGLGEGPDKAWTTHVRVRDVTIRGAGRMGVSVVAGRDVVVERTTMSGIGLTPMDIEPNGTGDGANDVTFRANRVAGPLTGGFFATLGKGPVDHIRVEDNVLTGAGMHMVLLAPPGERRSDYTVTGNRATTPYSVPGSVAFDFDGIDGAVVKRNRVPLGAPNMALTATVRSCGITVADNAFPGGVAEARFAAFGCSRPNTVR